MIRIILLFFCCSLLLEAGEAASGSRTNLALHALVTCSNGENPEYAVDGKRGGAFFAGAWGPEHYLEIDLGDPCLVDGLHIFFWSGDRRVYLYYAQLSEDGKNWQTAADGRKNQKISSPDGDAFDFAGKRARFVRLYILKNSVNASSHVRELEVYGRRLRQ